MTWGVPLLVSYHIAISYCSWGSQGKNTEVACQSLLQWTRLCQTSPPWPAHLGLPRQAWLGFIELDKAVVPHCNFDLYFPDDQCCLRTSHVLTDHLLIFFGKRFIPCLPTFYLGCLLLNLRGSFYILNVLRYVRAHILSHLLRLSFFFFFKVFLGAHKVFNFVEVQFISFSVVFFGVIGKNPLPHSRSQRFLSQVL